MSVFLALGSNADDRIRKLESGIAELNQIGKVLRVSPIYETAAATPTLIPGMDWISPFINLVIEFEPLENFTPHELLEHIKIIEKKLGRAEAPPWAPRPIDIDILYWDNLQLNAFNLQIPHSRILERAFVLDPLKDLLPLHRANDRSLVQLARETSGHSPCLMAIINLTPDSFSDGGKYNQFGEFEAHVEEIENKVAYIDLGAESTRPNATPITAEAEWERLEPFLHFLTERYEHQAIHPKISIDTRHYPTMQRAADLGIDMINDVSGLTDPQLQGLFLNSDLDFVLMHSLSVPPTPTQVLSTETSPMLSLKDWYHHRLAELEGKGLSRDRIIIDPGIGFGKTPEQNLEILAHIKDLQSFNCRLLVGASRKSFIKALAPDGTEYREAISNGINHYLADQGVDILRLHSPIEFHYERLTQQQMRSLHGCTFHKN